jgi:hypothetical protein
MIDCSPEETIETANITTSSFDAEQGMAGGASVTVTTKSGANQFHGVGFAYWDDNHLQARNFFFSIGTAPTKCLPEPCPA